MPHKAIIQTEESVISKLVLSDPPKPESLKDLLPILKQTHTLCREHDLQSEAKDLVKAIHFVESILKNGIRCNKIYYSALETFIFDFILKLKHLNHPESVGNLKKTAPRKTANRQQKSEQEQLEKKLDELFLLISGFCPGKLPYSKKILNCFTELAHISKEIQPSTFKDISNCCREYVKHTPLENLENLKPIEDVVGLLKSILSHLKEGHPFVFDYPDVLERLQKNRAKHQNNDLPRDGDPAIENPIEKRPKRLMKCRLKKKSKTQSGGRRFNWLIRGQKHWMYRSCVSAQKENFV